MTWVTGALRIFRASPSRVRSPPPQGNQQATPIVYISLAMSIMGDEVVAAARGHIAFANRDPQLAQDRSVGEAELTHSSTPLRSSVSERLTQGKRAMCEVAYICINSWRL